MKGHIEIRRWFNGVATYYSSRVHRFDAEGYPECVLIEAFAYGYGSHGANEAAKGLGFEGIGEATRAGYTHSVCDVARKRDM